MHACMEGEGEIGYAKIHEHDDNDDDERDDDDDNNCYNLFRTDHHQNTAAIATATEQENAETTPPNTCAANLFPANNAAAQQLPMMMMSSGKKRGRPKKYGPDGIALQTTSQANTKQGKERQLLASLGEWFACSAGGNFMPHVVTIATGEDVSTKILSFSQKGPRAICILSANGAISNVTLRQPGSSGGTLTYEGRFEILSLSGSFTVSEDSGVRSRTGGISVSLAGPDGRVIGGGVAGLLIAASPIQVVVGSFLPNTFKKNAPSEATSPALSAPTNVLTSAKPISQATPHAIGYETPTSTIPAQVHRDAENGVNDQNMNSSYRATGWHGLQPSEHRPSPDINICLHGE